MRKEIKIIDSVYNVRRFREAKGKKYKDMLHRYVAFARIYYYIEYMQPFGEIAKIL